MSDLNTNKFNIKQFEVYIKILNIIQLLQLVLFIYIYFNSFYNWNWGIGTKEILLMIIVEIITFYFIFMNIQLVKFTLHLNETKRDN